MEASNVCMLLVLGKWLEQWEWQPTCHLGGAIHWESFV